MKPKKKLVHHFPGLGTSTFVITSPKSIDYNCIAWAAGNAQRWWEPDPFSIGYWPPRLPRQQTLDVYVRLFQLEGYERCASEGHEKGFDRIAIYANQAGLPTHAARQLTNGTWTSKLGKLEDIQHKNLKGLEGKIYGTVAVIMRRAQQGK